MLRRLAALNLLVINLALATPGRAEESDPRDFLERQHARISALVGQPRTPERDARIDEALDGLADFDELSRRTLGQPCPVAEPGCQNHWATLDDAQRTEVRRLLRQLVSKHVVDRVERMRDYDVAFRGVSRNRAGETRIRTVVTSRLSAREPSLAVDFVVRPCPGGYRVVDIVTEGSSLTRNYYDQIHEMFANPATGYAGLVGRLADRVARR